MGDGVVTMSVLRRTELGQTVHHLVCCSEVSFSHKPCRHSDIVCSFWSPRLLTTKHREKVPLSSQTLHWKSKSSQC